MQKQAFFSATKHLFCFKNNGQNRRFNLWTCAVSGCVWKHPEWILSVSMQLYAGLYDFWTVVWWFFFDLVTWWPLFTILRLFGPKNGSQLVKNVPKYFKNGHYWVIFGPLLGPSASFCSYFRDGFGIVLVSFRTPFRAFLVRLWGEKPVIFSGFWGQKMYRTLKPYFEEDT